MDVPEGLTNDVEAALSALDQAPLLQYCFEGPELRCVMMNAQIRALVGQDILGRPLEESLAQMVGQQLFERIREVYYTGVPFVGNEWRLDIPTADGEMREHYLSFTYSPWRYPDGTMRGMVGTGQDITDVVLARRAAEAETAGLRKQYEHTHELMTVLQEALLPSRLPVLPGLDLSARYLLAETETTAGGDWFDTVLLDDGRVALMVGDVVGHGVRASAVMGQLRSSLATLLQSNPDPAESMTRLERFARRIPGAIAATVCVAVLDPTTGALAYCTAGHPPPLIASTSGNARYVEPSGGSPLGAGSGYETRHDQLDVDDVLLLYTDGIIERPQRAPEQATVELLTTAADAAAGRAFTVNASPQPAHRATEQVMELLTRITGHTDDITLFAAHRRTPVAAFTRSGPAVAGVVAQWRTEFDVWLRTLAPEAVVAIGVQHAVVELTTNAVEHAYAGSAPGELSLTAALTASGDLEISVRDRGRWKDAASASDRGRGLALAGAMVDELTFDRSPDGTTATVRTALTQATSMVAGTSKPSAERAEFSGHLADHRLLVSGPIDISTAREFDSGLREATRHAISPLTVDLSDVTHLASAGIQILAAALRRSEDRLVLFAPPGSPAQHVLALTQLPHNTDLG